LIDPVTIPEDYQYEEGFYGTHSTLYMPYEYKCLCGPGFLRSTNMKECVPCSDIHADCTSCSYMNNA